VSSEWPPAEGAGVNVALASLRGKRDRQTYDGSDWLAGWLFYLAVVDGRRTAATGPMMATSLTLGTGATLFGLMLAA
jgi:hypothetical protein